MAIETEEVIDKQGEESSVRLVEDHRTGPILCDIFLVDADSITKNTQFAKKIHEETGIPEEELKKMAKIDRRQISNFQIGRRFGKKSFKNITKFLRINFHRAVNRSPFGKGVIH